MFIQLKENVGHCRCKFGHWKMVTKVLWGIVTLLARGSCCKFEDGLSLTMYLCSATYGINLSHLNFYPLSRNNYSIIS